MGSTLKVVSMLQAGRPADPAKMARSSTNILFPCGKHTKCLVSWASCWKGARTTELRVPMSACQWCLNYRIMQMAIARAECYLASRQVCLTIGSNRQASPEGEEAPLPPPQLLHVMYYTPAFVPIGDKVVVRRYIKV